MFSKNVHSLNILKKVAPDLKPKNNFIKDPCRTQDQLKCCCSSNKRLICSIGYKID